MVRNLAAEVRWTLFDPNNPASISAKARGRRWQEFTRRFPDLQDMRVLDLGGYPAFWMRDPRPAAVTTVNIDSAETPQPWMSHVVADACLPPAGLRAEQFDLVVSNSLLEHVGGYYRRRMLADVVHSAAERHWIQTPNRYFPVEPHWLAPGWQFLAVPARARILQHWSISHDRPADRRAALDVVLSTELVSRAEMQLVFPDSEIWCERVLGLAKSLVAVRQ